MPEADAPNTVNEVSEGRALNVYDVPAGIAKFAVVAAPPKGLKYKYVAPPVGNEIVTVSLKAVRVTVWLAPVTATVTLVPFARVTCPLLTVCVTG